jgi:hypothetical protein
MEKLIIRITQLSQANFDIIYRGNTASDIAAGLTLISKSSLPVNHKHVSIILLNSGGASYYIAQILISLYNCNPKLISSNKEFILKNINYVRYLPKTFDLISRIAPRIMSDKIVKLIFSESGFFDYHWDEIREILMIIARKDSAIITPAFFSLLTKSKEQYNYEKFRNKFLIHVLQVLTTFEFSNPELITTHHLKQIFTTEGEDLIPIAKVLTAINNINPQWLTSENVDSLFRHKESVIILLNTLLALQATHPHLLTEKNINVLIQRPQAANSISQILINLEDKHIPVDEAAYTVLAKDKTIRDVAKVTAGIERRLQHSGFFARSATPAQDEKKSTKEEKKSIR